MIDLGPSVDLGSNGGAAILCGLGARVAFIHLGVLIGVVAICTYALFEAAAEVSN